MNKKDPDKLIPGIDTYPNLGPPEVMPEGFKQIKLLPSQQNPPPQIRWGEQYQNMPIDKQLRRAQKVASAMNHAADIAQQRVQELIDIANHQERQLDQNKVDFAKQRELLTQMMTQNNAEKQARLQEMQLLKAELRAAQKQLKDLKGE